MIIRKLNGGDSKGCIVFCRRMYFTTWAHNVAILAPMVEKGYYPSFQTSDVASLFEVMPAGTSLTNWGDEEYKLWTKKHAHKQCDECGAKGNILRKKDGSYEVLDVRKCYLSF